MKGQWIGTYTGSSTGRIVVNIDELATGFQGVAYLTESNSALPNTAVSFRTPDKANEFKVRTDALLPLDPSSGLPAPWESVRSKFADNVSMPEYADVTGAYANDALSLSWTTDIGTAGNCVLPKSMADRPSELVPLNKNWATFRDYVAGLEGRRLLFRGQNAPWRLRTSFHRTLRADLTRFLREDIQVLHKHLSATTKHVFTLEIPNENGAFYNLIQHHGYPTPLLDWTYSPYVAAFFAYRGISNTKAAEAGPEDMVRILIFDQEQWRSDWNQLLQLLAPGLHLSIGEFMAIENERMIPQQAASTVTNVDDIESYIRSKETETKKYLTAIDLPVRERRQVARELGYMGITAGSLFPGLDGACEELRERNFDF